MKKVLTLAPLVLFSLIFLAAPAQAVTVGPDDGLTLDLNPALTYQQQAINPCVIGAPNCLNGGFPFTSAGSGGAGSIFDVLSPVYTTAQVLGVVGASPFQVGFDWNQSSDDQTLYVFEAIYTNAGGEVGRQTFDIQTTHDATAQGNGNSDFIMSGFTIAAGATNVQFRARWFNNDGADRFFLIGAGAVPCEQTPGGCPPLAPEPATLALFGIGLAGAAAAARRRRSSGN